MKTKRTKIEGPIGLTIQQRVAMLRELSNRTLDPIISSALTTTAEAMEEQEKVIAIWREAAQSALEDRRRAMIENEDLRFKLNGLESK